MANEKRVNVSFQTSLGGLTAGVQKSASYDFSGNNFTGALLVATTSYVAIPLGALASFERVAILNNDSTNAIEIAGSATPGEMVISIKAGEVNYFTPKSTTTLYIKAITASVNYLLVACEP